MFPLSMLKQNNIDQRDSNGFAAIHHAIQRGYTSVIETLISHGSDINIQSNDGQTCLHYAIKLCYREDRDVELTETLKKVPRLLIMLTAGG